MRRVVALGFQDIIVDGPDASAPSPTRLQLRASELERLLSELRHLGYQTVSSRAFRQWQGGAGVLPERSMVLTFDDGHASHLELVVPLLLRFRSSGTFFIAVDRIGQPDYLNWDQLRKLIFLGMEIGSRGAPQGLPGPASKTRLVDELIRSRELLEDRLGVPVRALAVPGGDWNGAIASAARRAGFDAVWISTLGTNGRDTHPFGLRRIPVRQPFSLQSVIALIDGWQPTFRWAARHEVAIRTLKRVLGVYGYERLKRRLVPKA